MGRVYLYDAHAEDFTTIGLCGALMPLRCEFHEIANGLSSIEMEHPMDALGRYRYLLEERILKCDVPVRTTPEISNRQFVTVIEQYTVKSTSTTLNRYIYNKSDPSAKSQQKLKQVPVGGAVSIIAKYADDNLRWKCKYTWTEKQKKKTVSKTVTGYIAHDSTTLDYTQTVTVDGTSAGIEAVAPSWRIEEQLFRIVTVEKIDNTIRVIANHISYDLMDNMTSYEQDGSKTLQEAGEEMLAACFDDHHFTFQTNIQGAKQGFHFRDKDPITALLDPEIGLVPRWGGEMIRDNFGFTVLDHAGMNRGTMFTYGKNVKGITMNLDIADVTTAIRPVGETEDGKPIYLDHSYLWDGETATALSDTRGIVYGRWHEINNGELICRMSHARIRTLNGEECREDKKDGPNVETVRRRLLDQSIAKLSDGSESPKITVKVDIQQVGYTQQWAEYRELEKVFLFDTVRVFYPAMGINISTPVCEIVWDCLEDMPSEITTGEISELTSRLASWQIPSGISGSKLTPGTVTAMCLSLDAISEAMLMDGSVTTGKIVDGAVTADKLDAGLPLFRLLLTSYSPTEAQLATWSADGYESWWTTTTATTGIRAGDAVALRVSDAARGGYAFIIGVVTATGGGNTVNVVSRGLMRNGTAGARGASTWALGTNYTYSQSQINQYGAAGYEGVWNITDDITGVMAGDVAMVRVANSDTGGNSIILATVLQVIANNGQLQLRSVSVMG